MSQYDSIPRVHEMTPFTDCENDELLLFIKALTGRGVVPIKLAETSITELQAPVDRKKCPLKTAAEALLLNDMFASFLSSGRRSGNIIAVSGGFGAGRMYHIVGAWNTGNGGVRRPSDKLCTALERACNDFILGSTMPLNPDDISAILVTALDICHAPVARRLTRISTACASLNTSTLDEQGLQDYSNFRSFVSDLTNNLEKWEGLKSQKKTVATSYGWLLRFSGELWDKIKDFAFIQSQCEVRPFYELNTIMKGLQLLRKFPRGTRVVFDWPQGPIDSDRFWCQPATWQTVIEDLINKSATGDHELRNKMRGMWKDKIGTTEWTKTILHADCQLHCEIYLALYILFSESNVRFPSFRVEEKKRVFAIGCSKESCVSCWDVLLGLFRQDSPDHPIYACRTRRSSGKCYATWGLTPHVEDLPPSLRQAVTGSRETLMRKSLSDALKYTHQQFKQRVEPSM